MAPVSGTKPGGGVAKALATVFSPAAGTRLAVIRRERLFTPFGGPSELAGGTAPDLRREQTLVNDPRRISEPPPREMREFVKKNAVELVRFLFQCAIENNQVLAEKGSPVNGLALVAAGEKLSTMRRQIIAEQNSNGLSRGRFQPSL